MVDNSVCGRMFHVPVVDPKLMPPPVLLLGGAAGSPNPPKVVVPAVVPAPNAAGVDAAGAAVVVGAPPKENGPGDAPKLKDTEHNNNIQIINKNLGESMQ